MHDGDAFKQDVKQIKSHRIHEYNVKENKFKNVLKVDVQKSLICD